MEKASSCIIVLPQYSDALKVRDMLVEAGFDKQQISIIGKGRNEGEVAALELDKFDEDLRQLGVQDVNLYCYKCSLHAGSVLVVISGDYAGIEKACNVVEHLEQADVALHFNTL